MLLANTNSLMYIVEIENVYQDFFKDKRMTSAIIQKNQNIMIMKIS